MNIDLRILELLEDEATLSPKDMAMMLDSDEKTVKKRIDKLKKDGIIKKYKTVIDWKKAGKRSATAMIQVKVTPQEKAGFAKICKDLARDPKVQDVFVATGEYDLVIFIKAETLDEISEFITEKLAPKKDVLGTYTHIILSEFKRDGAILSDDGKKRLPVTI